MSNVKKLYSIKREISIFNEKLNAIERLPEGKGDYIAIKDSYSEKMEVPPVPDEFSSTIDGVCQKCLPYLHSLRDPVANYQEKRGIKKEETYNFYDLVTAVGQYMYNSVSSMGKMVSNLLPIIDACLLITRFILDKLIEIMESQDNDRVQKAAIFIIEFIPIFFIVGFIYGFIFMPLYALFVALITKLWAFVL